MSSNRLYRIVSYIGHQLWSWNTGGEGIHSPYLFYLVRYLMYDQNRFYCWQSIEHVRHLRLADKTIVEVEDFGTGKNQPSHRSIAYIAKNSLERAQIGQLLFRLIAYIGHQTKRPLRCVELGTSLGITTAYMALPSSKNHIVTYEGSGAIAQVAQQNWKQLGIQNIELVIGNIDNTFLQHDQTNSRTIDILYIDANHTKEATLRYFRHALPSLTENSICIFDDIYFSPEMQQAWKEICQMPMVTSTMNLYHVGIVFFNHQYLHKNYKLRL